MGSRGLPSLLARRLVGAAVVVVLSTALAWLLLHAMRPELFPDRPSWESQWRHYLTRAFLHFDLGTSRRGLNIAEVLRQSILPDLSVFAGGLAVGALGGLAGGALLAGAGRGKLAAFGQFLALVAMSTPVFVTGLSVLLLFGAGIAMVDIGVHVPLKYVEFGDSPIRWFGALIVPWLVLGLPLAGQTLRVMYGSTREALGEEPVQVARGKGVPERAVLLRHAGPLGAGPALSIVSASANLLLTNMILTEKVFAVPGVFNRLPQAVSDADPLMLLMLTMVGAAFVALTTMLSDVALRRLDPRPR